MIKKGDLVSFVFPGKSIETITGLVCRDPYVTVFATVHERTQKTISSSEKVVVDVLVDGTIYKKILVDSIDKTG